jgi:hypothetical protein
VPTGVAGSSAAQGGTAGTENFGGQGAEAGEAGQGNAGEGSGGTGGVAGTGGSGGAGAGGTSGVGGTAGTDGSGGRAGSSGAGGAGAGGAGAGGAAGIAGAGGSAGGTVASGCARLSVPLDGADDRAHFVVSLTTPLDFSDAVITMRVYAAAASGGSIFSYVQGPAPFRFLGNSVRPAFVAGWQTLTWDVGAEDPGSSMIDKASIKRIGIEVNALPSSAWASPTVLFVDSITVATPTQSFAFDTTGTVTSTAATSDPSSTVLWLNSGTSDTTATGVTLSWVATCP